MFSIFQKCCIVQGKATDIYNITEEIDYLIHDNAF